MTKESSESISKGFLLVVFVSGLVGFVLGFQVAFPFPEKIGQFLTSLFKF